MGKRTIERRLRRTGDRLRSLRDELRVIDEQLAHLVDDAGDLEVRAIVADTSGPGYEHRKAREHVDAMTAHRAHVVAEIQRLEQRQDELLDELTAS